MTLKKLMDPSSYARRTRTDAFWAVTLVRRAYELGSNSFFRVMVASRSMSAGLSSRQPPHRGVPRRVATSGDVFFGGRSVEAAPGGVISVLTP